MGMGGGGRKSNKAYEIKEESNLKMILRFQALVPEINKLINEASLGYKIQFGPGAVAHTCSTSTLGG